jgi:hypothetical protein
MNYLIELDAGENFIQIAAPSQIAMDKLERQRQRLNFADISLLNLDVVKRVEIVKGPNMVTLLQETFADMGPNEAGATGNQEIHRRTLNTKGQCVEPATKQLALEVESLSPLEMGLPSQPITLSVEQLDQLNRKLANMRHDINNTLSLMMAAVELIKCKPQMTEKMIVTLLEQPPKIGNSLVKFSAEFEQTFGITRN